MRHRHVTVIVHAPKDLREHLDAMTEAAQRAVQGFLKTARSLEVVRQVLRGSYKGPEIRAALAIREWQRLPLHKRLWYWAVSAW